MTDNHSFSTPILLIVFNRPEMARRVFERIRTIRPARLFVACDGPRLNHPGEWEKMREARRIATEIDWPCELKTRFSETNMGCRVTLSAAIDWFFSEVEEGIIFEEDCLPNITFFSFCQELLERYRNDERIMNISGTNGLLCKADLHESYYFSCYPHIWGWATWRRAWQYYDSEMSDLPDFLKTGFPVTNFPDFAERKRWREILEKVYRHDPNFDTWDMQWAYTHFKRDALSVTPRENLVENIGCTPDAMHTANCIYAGMPATATEFPLIHPAIVHRNAKLDELTFQIAYANPLRKRILNRFNRIVQKIHLRLRKS